MILIINKLGLVILNQVISKLLTLNKHRFCCVLFCTCRTAWSVKAVNNILESTMSNLSKPIKFTHLWKLANQSTSKGARATEITKACTVAFMKARNSLVVQFRKIGKKKKTENGENIFFKALTNRSKPCQRTAKLFMEGFLSNGLHEKVMICSLK